MSRVKDRVHVIGLDFRIMHVILILGSAFLLYSALGADDDERIVSSGLNLYFLHRYVGLVWGFLLVMYGIYALIRRRRVRILEPLGKPIIEQIKEGFSVIGKYFLNIRISEGVRSKMGRHNIMASYAFVMLLFGFLMLAVGGLGMIYLPGGGDENDFFLGIHIAGAGLLVLFVLAHGFAVLNKSNWPLLSAVFFNGKVRKEWADHSMPRYMLETVRKPVKRRYRRVRRNKTTYIRVVK